MGWMASSRADWTKKHRWALISILLQTSCSFLHRISYWLCTIRSRGGSQFLSWGGMCRCWLPAPWFSSRSVTFPCRRAFMEKPPHFSSFYSFSWFYCWPYGITIRWRSSKRSANTAWLSLCVFLDCTTALGCRAGSMREPNIQLRSSVCRLARLEQSVGHHSETRDHDDRRRPAEKIRPRALLLRHRRMIGHHLAHQKPGDQSSKVRKIVNSGHQDSQDTDIDNTFDELASKHLHRSAAPFGCNREK